MHHKVRTLVPFRKCLLRNLLTLCSSIVDFEHYHEVQEGKEMDEKDEMERWGLLRTPARTWYQEWGLVK